MTVMEVVLVAVGGWFVVSALMVPLAQPLLGAVKKADREERDARRTLRRSRTLETPRSSGYAAIVLERLLWHGCVVQGAEQACLLVEDERGRLVVVAGHEIDEDLLGRRFPAGAGRRPASVSGLPDGARIPDLRRGRAARAAGVRRDRGRRGDLRAAAPRAGGAGRRRARPPRERRSCRTRTRDPRSPRWSAELQAADHHTESHCQAVATMACAVGRELGPRRRRPVRARGQPPGCTTSASCSCPREILDKPGPLDAQERELICMHPEWGAEIVGRIPGLAAVALLVRLHHERLDGDGYPHGLPAERIPIASRIVSVCDAHSAIVDDRPYRAGRSQPRRRSRSCAGTRAPSSTRSWSTRSSARCVRRRPFEDTSERVRARARVGCRAWTSDAIKAGQREMWGKGDYSVLSRHPAAGRGGALRRLRGLRRPGGARRRRRRRQLRARLRGRGRERDRLRPLAGHGRARTRPRGGGGLRRRVGRGRRRAAAVRGRPLRLRRLVVRRDDRAAAAAGGARSCSGSRGRATPSA